MHATYPCSYPDLWSTARVPGLIRWMPSRITSFPSKAAVTSGDGLQAVSPLGRVYLCCSKSLAVMSCQFIRRIYLYCIAFFYRYLLSLYKITFCFSWQYTQRRLAGNLQLLFERVLETCTHAHEHSHTCYVKQSLKVLGLPVSPHWPLWN